MRFLLFLSILIGAQALVSSGPKLIATTTLTRHGSRAPDKILAKVSCSALLPRKPEQGLTSVFVDKFGTLPGELTAYGEQQMEVVGKFIKKRYGKDGLNFVDTDNFYTKTTDWSFVARAGSRQQRSMMAVARGIFPDTSVPIGVMDRSSDNTLGGPAPACGSGCCY